MKKLLSISLVSIMLFSSTVFSAEKDVLKLDDVLNKSIEYSKKLKIDEMNIGNAEKVYNTAVKDSDAINISIEEDAKWYIPQPNRAGITAKRKEKDVTPEQRKYEMKLSVKNEELDKNDLVIEVYNTYYSLLKQNNEIKIKTSELNLVKDQFTKTTDKYKKGMISKNEYKLAQLGKKDAEVKLNLAKRMQKRLGLKLYNLMGQGYSPDIKAIDEKLEYTDLKNVNVDEVVKKAIENRIEMFKAKEELTLKEKELEVVDMYYEDNQLEYTDAQNNLEEAKLNVEVKEQDIEFEIRTSYNNLLNLLDTIEVNKQEVEKAKIDYNAAELKSSLGMITKTELDAVKLELEKANNQLSNSIIDYIIARQKFDFACGIGPAVQ